MSRKPLCIDLFSGLGGWSDGFLAEGYDCIGFDVERHRYPSRATPEGHVKAPGADWNRGDSFNGTTEKRLRESPLTGGWDEYPGQLVLQDVLTLRGSQFRGAACIVASPPCQEFSYMAMPWTRAKQIALALRGDDNGINRDDEWGAFPEGYAGSRTVAQLTALFDACFRIQREASEAAGHHIPMVVENVKGAQPWVGRANANYGSFYLWGDVRSVGGRIMAAHRVEFGAPGVKAYRAMKCGHPERSFRDGDVSTAHLTNRSEHGRKVPMNFHEHEKTGKPGRSFQSAAVEARKQPVWFNDDKRRATKCGGDWFGPGEDCSLMRSMGSKSSARKAASAQIAKIPPELSAYIARSFYPDRLEATA